MTCICVMARVKKKAAEIPAKAARVHCFGEELAAAVIFILPCACLF